MQTTNTPLSKSRLQIEFELPPERLARSIDAATRRFRSNTASRAFVRARPSINCRARSRASASDEAVELLVEDAFRQRYASRISRR